MNSKRVIAFFFLILPALALAEDKTFAVVPKFMNHVFFDYARDGCKKAESEMPGFKCLYTGPANFNEEEQVKVINDLITRKVDAIAIAPLNAPAVGKALKQAKDSGIPIITWDSDVLEGDRIYRKTYIGTNNYEIGVNLAKLIIAVKPNGGTIAIQSGAPAAANLNERVQGLRDTLKGHSWTEVTTNPYYCNDDGGTAAQQLADILTKYPNLDAFTAVGAWPQIAHQAYRSALRNHIDKIKRKELAIVIADTLPVQLDLLREGLSHGQVGQRPFEMGYKSMYIMKDLLDKKEVIDPIYTPLDVCRAENIDTCIKS